MSRRRKQRREDPRMEGLLRRNIEKEAATEYLAKIGDAAPASAILAEPDQQTIWRVLEWLFSEAGSGAMEADLAAIFDSMLRDYKIKNRIMAYAVTRERIQRMVEAIELEREISEDLRNALPYMSNENKVKAMAAISASIAASLENLDKMAGITDVSEDVLSALQGHLKDSPTNKPIKEMTGEERENVRKFIETIKSALKPKAEFTTLAPEEPSGTAQNPQ